MPANLDALIRYHTIDSCLQNRFRLWSWENLATACFEALDEVRYRSVKNTVSKRTIENDIRIMRSGLLGYYAPIECKKGIYRYTDQQYSIKNATLSRQDLETIAISAKVLGQYKGLDLYEDLSRVIQRTETKLQFNHYEQSKQYIHFEHFPASKGQEFLQPLLDAIRSQTVLELSYKRFDKPSAWSHLIHPYLLKEYRNRWYLLGLTEKHQKITTFALDRMVSYEHRLEITYRPNQLFDPEIYYQHTIGITYSGETPISITLFVQQAFVPYVLTQPLHESQQLLEEQEGGSLFQLCVVNNPELQTLLLGYSDMISVIGPPILKKVLKERLEKAVTDYRR